MPKIDSNIIALIRSEIRKNLLVSSGSGDSSNILANAIRVGPDETYTTVKDAGDTEGWDNHFYIVGDTEETSQVSISGVIDGEYYIFIDSGVEWLFTGVVTNLNINSTGTEYRLHIVGLGVDATIVGKSNSNAGAINVSRTNNGLRLKNLTYDARQHEFSNRTMVRGGQVYLEDLILVNTADDNGVPAIHFGNSLGWNPADIQRKWPIGAKNIRYLRDGGSAPMDEIVQTHLNDHDTEINIEQFSIINVYNSLAFDFTDSGNSKVNVRKLSFEGSSRSISATVDSLDICEHDLTELTLNVKSYAGRVNGNPSDTTNINLTEAFAKAEQCSNVAVDAQADFCSIENCTDATFQATQTVDFLTIKNCEITSAFQLDGNNNYLEQVSGTDLTIGATANNTAYLGLSLSGALTDNGTDTVNLTNRILGAAVGMAKSGLYLKTDFGTLAGQFAYGFDRLVFADIDGNKIERTSVSDVFSPAGMVNSTHYYVYLTTYLGGPITVVISTDSVRMGDTFSGLTGLNTHFREIGEFYVNSSGDVVEFKRVGDVVEFGNYTDHALFTGQNLSTTYANAAYPAATPERADSLLLLSSSNYAGNQATRIVYAEDNAGTNEVSAEGYMLSSWGAYNGNYLNVPCKYRPTPTDLTGGLWYRSTATSSVNNHSIYLAGYEWTV